MNLEEDILIENYLKGKLSESEEKDFLERMSNDNNFEEKVIFEKQLFETLNEKKWSFVKNTDLEELKNLDSVFKSDAIKKTEESISVAFKEYKKSKKSSKKNIYFAVASIALLITIYSLFFTTNYTNSELYAQYIQVNELQSNINRGEEDSLDDLVSAELYFKEKNYAKALPDFINALSNNKNNASIYVYIAISEMELNKYNEAEKTLDNLINSGLIDAQKGYWYKSLLFIKANQVRKAKSQLEFIIKNSYYKHREAKELLEDL